MCVCLAYFKYTHFSLWGFLRISFCFIKQVKLIEGTLVLGDLMLESFCLIFDSD